VELLSEVSRARSGGTCTRRKPDDGPEPEKGLALALNPNFLEKSSWKNASSWQLEVASGDFFEIFTKSRRFGAKPDFPF
jgi:hypothetical protein